MQLTIVFIILLAAAAYAGWRIYKVLTRKSNPCDNCPGCSLKKKGADGKLCR